MSIEAMKLTDPHDHPEPHTMKWTQLEMDYINKRVEAAVRQAIEQAQPVTCDKCHGLGNIYMGCGSWIHCNTCNTTGKIHAPPPSQPLTDEEIMDDWYDAMGSGTETYLPIPEFARAIEANLKEKNS